MPATSTPTPPRSRPRWKRPMPSASKELLVTATGRRKESIARVRLKPGSGEFVVNDRTLDEYFGRETSKMILKQPLEVVEQVGKVDISVNVCGGGLSGQAGAIRHGISRALTKLNPDFRPALGSRFGAWAALRYRAQGAPIGRGWR